MSTDPSKCLSKLAETKNVSRVRKSAESQKKSRPAPKRNIRLPSIDEPPPPEPEKKKPKPAEPPAAPPPVSVSALSREEPLENRVAQQLAQMYAVPVDKDLIKYCYDRCMHSVADKRDAFPSEDEFLHRRDDGSFRRNDIWHSWAFPFEDKRFYGNLRRHVSLFCPREQDMRALQHVCAFLQSRLVRTEGDDNTTLTVGNILTYVRMYIDPEMRDHVTNAVLLIALWREDFHDHYAWRVGHTLLELPVRATYIDKPSVFDSAFSTHGLDAVLIDWTRKLCSVALMFFEMSKRNDAWRVQFSGMHAYVRAAFEYYAFVRPVAFSHRPLDDETAVSAADFFSSIRTTHATPVDVTDASFSCMRLRVRDYENNFGWMFVAAYALAHGAFETRVHCISTFVHACGGWDACMLPATTLPRVVAAAPCLVPRYLAKVFSVTRNAQALGTLNVLLRITERVKVPLQNCTAYYKDLLFDSPRYAPHHEPTIFMSRVERTELHGVFVSLDQYVDARDDYSAFVIATALLNTDVNKMFEFDDCPPRKALFAALSDELKDVVGRKSTRIHGASFLSNANSSFWWWMFARGDMDAVTRTSMAYACEVACRYAGLAQMAMWAAFVRVVGKWDLQTAAHVAADDGDDSEFPDVCRFAGVVAASKPLVEPVHKDDDKMEASTDFMCNESHMRAYVAMCYPRAFRVDDHHSSNVLQGALLHLLLRGDWKDPDTPRCMHALLFGADDEDKELVSAEEFEDRHPFEGFAEAVERMVDSTALKTVMQTNATLSYLYPTRILNSLVHKFCDRIKW